MPNDRLRLLTALLLICALAVQVQAQSSADFVVPGAFQAGSWMWAADNRTFVFGSSVDGWDAAGNPIVLDHAIWRAFDVLTQTLSEPQDEWPLQPALSAAKLAQFQPRGAVLAAPNGNLLIFTRQGRLYLANRATGAVTETPFLFPSDGALTDYGNQTNWSADGTAFVYAQGAVDVAAQTVYQVRIPPNGDLHAAVATPFSGTLIGGAPFTTFDAPDHLLDLSADGKRVLLIGRRVKTDAENDRTPYLIVWYPEDGARSALIRAIPAEDVCDAAFTSDDEGQIVTIMKDGRLLLDDLEANAVTILDTNLPTDCGYASVFSPNGAWLALYDSGSGKLRFLNVARLIEQASAA